MTDNRSFLSSFGCLHTFFSLSPSTFFPLHRQFPSADIKVDVHLIMVMSFGLEISASLLLVIPNLDQIIKSRREMLTVSRILLSRMRLTSASKHYCVHPLLFLLSPYFHLRLHFCSLCCHVGCVFAIAIMPYLIIDPSTHQVFAAITNLYIREGDIWNTGVTDFLDALAEFAKAVAVWCYTDTNHRFRPAVQIAVPTRALKNTFYDLTSAMTIINERTTSLSFWDLSWYFSSARLSETGNPFQSSHFYPIPGSSRVADECLHVTNVVQSKLKAWSDTRI